MASNATSSYFKNFQMQQRNRSGRFTLYLTDLSTVQTSCSMKSSPDVETLCLFGCIERRAGPVSGSMASWLWSREQCTTEYTVCFSLSTCEECADEAGFTPVQSSLRPDWLAYSDYLYMLDFRVCGRHSFITFTFDLQGVVSVKWVVFRKVVMKLTSSWWEPYCKIKKRRSMLWNIMWY